MLDIILLGTAGKVPLPKRNLSSAMLSYNGGNLLIDCGEGTQMAIRKNNKKAKAIDAICITHFHADHTSGLTGVLLAIANAGREKELAILGPAGIDKIINAALVVIPKLPFQIKTVEVKSGKNYHVGGFRLQPFYADHGISCYGYNVFVDRRPKFDAEKARRLMVPEKYWDCLISGSIVFCDDGRTIKPNEVCGGKRAGIKVSYLTDSRPTDSIVDAVNGADLLVCEGMYADPSYTKKAIESKHMLFSEASKIAADAMVSELWLTHYCQMITDPVRELENSGCKRIFSNIVAGYDGLCKKLSFKE